MITLLIVMVTGSYNQGGYREGGELEEKFVILPGFMVRVVVKSPASIQTWKPHDMPWRLKLYMGFYNIITLPHTQPA